MNAKTEVCQARVWFNGRVQGVGFRYKSRETAKEFEVCGEVKNLSDGRVELCVEGRQSEVEAFIAELEARMRPFIRKTEKQFTTGPRRYRDFAITHET